MLFTVCLVMQQVAENFSDIYHHVEQMYERSSSLVYVRGQSLKVAQSVTIPVAQFRTDVLDTPVGSPEFIQPVTKAANWGRKLSSKLTELGDQQSAVLLLRYYHVPRTNHLASLVQPHDLLQAAGSHDNMTRYALISRHHWFRLIG